MAGAAALFQLEEWTQPELDLQVSGAEAFERLILPPATWTAFPMGHIRLSGDQAARLYRIGAKPNWPDHLVLHAGKLIGIEWKIPGERLSRSRVVHTRRGRPRWVMGQEDAFPLLKAAGMVGPFLCITVEQALLILEAEGVPMRKWRIAA